MPKKLKKLLLVCSVTYLALVPASWGQRASNWRVYRAADGLPEPTCSSVVIIAPGKVLVGHPNQPCVSELDGYQIKVTSLPKLGNGRIWQTPSGQIWTSVPTGLLENRGNDWVHHPLPGIEEIKPNTPGFMDGVPPIFPVKQGLVLFLRPDQLAEFNSENLQEPRIRVRRLAAETRLGQFSGMAVARDGGLLIGGTHGLAKVAGPIRSLKPEGDWQEYLVPQELPIQNLQEPHEDEEGGITAVAESTLSGHKILVYYDGTQWRIMAAGTESILHGWRAADKSFWAITPNSLLQWDETTAKMVVNEEISARKYYDVAVEANGIFWLATSEGLFRHCPLVWQGLRGDWDVNSLIHGLAEDAADRLWFVSGNRLHVLKNDWHKEYAFPRKFERSLQSVRGLYRQMNGLLLLDTEGELITFQTDSGEFNAIPSTNQFMKRKILGLFKEGSLCVQCQDSESPLGYRLERWDSSRFERLPDLPEASLGKNLSSFFVAQNGDWWLSGDEGTACYRDLKWRTYTAKDNSLPKAALCFTDAAEGGIWCATQDKIWVYDGRAWLRLRRDFDRINAMLRARDGTIWIASNSGLHRFLKGRWLENSVEEGLPSSDVREIYEDQRGRIWVGTIRGLSIFHPKADPDPPLTRMQDLSEREKVVMEGKAINFSFRGQDKWKFTPRERLQYSYRLGQSEWSDFSEATVLSLTDLPAGKHYFWIRAMDRNGNLEPKPGMIEFTIALPWYKESRLVTISFVGLAGALFFAGLAWNRHRRLVHSYAEVGQIVTERTRELEIANRELLHSQKMTAMGTLASGIAHDFNNILSIIKGSAQIIEENLDNPQKVRTRLDRINTVVEQGSGIVAAMLGFSRESSQQLAWCDINAAVSDTIRLLGERFLRDVQIRYEPEMKLSGTWVSQGLLQQILLNFIFNAAESMTQSKRIAISTRSTDKPPSGMVRLPAKAETYVLVSVRDWGCGIPPENLPRIFEPFYTTKALSARRGMGLGLYMVYELTKKMEAGLLVQSVVGEGSTFTLVIPVRELPANTNA